MNRSMTSLALAFALTQSGCAGNPFMHFVNTVLGVDTAGQPPLVTGEFVREVAPGVPSELGIFPLNGVRFSADGERFAYVKSPPHTSTGRLHVGQGDRPATERSISAFPFLEWSPDGKLLAFAVAKEPDERGLVRFALKVLEVDTGKVSVLVEEVVTNWPWMTWSPDGRRFLYASRRNPDVPGEEDLNLYCREFGTVESSYIGLLASASEGLAQWLPDGDRVLYRAKAPGFSSACNLTLYDVETKTSTIVRRIPREAKVVLDSEGTHAAYLEGENSVNLEGRFAVFRIRLADGVTEETPFDLGKTTESGAYAAAGFISPDHRRCMVWHGNSPLFARDLSTGAHQQLTSSSATPWAWVEGGKAIIVTTKYGSVRRFYRVQVER